MTAQFIAAPRSVRARRTVHRLVYGDAQVSFPFWTKQQATDLVGRLLIAGEIPWCTAWRLCGTIALLDLS